MRVTGRGLAATVIVFVVAAVCVRLGFWQLDRLAQRRQLNAEMRARLTAPPVRLAAAPRDSTGWLHRRVLIAGAFDNDRSIIVPGRYYEGVPGAHVLTPVLLAAGSAVLADRGWVPAADGATVDLAALRLGTHAADSALVGPFPGQEPRLGRVPATSRAAPDSLFRRVWFAVDEAALRRQFPYELGSIHVRLLPSRTTAAPVRAPRRALDQGPHLGYAIQWFSFSMIAIGGWLVLLLKQGRRR